MEIKVPDPKKFLTLKFKIDLIVWKLKKVSGSFKTSLSLK